MDPAREAAIRQIYQQFLGRDEVDAPGLNYWMNSAVPTEKLESAIRWAASQPTVDETARPATNSYSAELLQDPGYAQFLRGIGLQESELQSRYLAAQDRIMRRQNLQEWNFKKNKDQAAQRIGESFADRGMYRSGRRLREQSDSDIRHNYNWYGMQTGANADQLSGMAADMGYDVANLRRQQGEQNLDTRASLTQGSLLI